MWARVERHRPDDEYIAYALGWRQREPYHTPPRAGDIYDPPPPPPPDLTEEEVAIVYAIHRGVVALARAEPDRAGVLVQYYGAYRNAPASQKERLMPIPGDRRRIHEQVVCTRDWIEGWAHGAGLLRA